MESPLFTPLQPMEPVIDYNLQNRSDFVYQLKWDGVRILCHVFQGEVRVWNKHRHQRTLQFPELQELSHHLRSSSAILDGEAVVLNNGRPSFPGIMRRDRCSSSGAIALLRRQFPVQYMIFDLLYIDGNSITNQSLAERRMRLEACLNPGGPFHLVENFSQGELLYQAVREQEFEGVVAKNTNSIYRPGKRHRDWLKYKNRRRCLAVVGGYWSSGQKVRSLLLGLFQDRRLFYIGRAGSGLKDRELAELGRELPKLKIPGSPFANLAAAGRDVHFVKPLLVVRLEFAEWSEDLRLRSPVILGFSCHPPQECRLIAAEEKEIQHD